MKKDKFKLTLKDAHIWKSATCMVYRIWVICGLNGWRGRGEWEPALAALLSD